MLCYIIYLYICPISTGVPNAEKYITDHLQLQASPFSNSTASIQASHSCNLPISKSNRFWNSQICETCWLRPKKAKKNMLVSWPQSPLPDSQDPQRMDLLEDLGAPGMPRSRDRSWPYLTKLQCFPASRSMATLRHGGVRGVEPSNIGNLSIKHIDLTWVNHQESRSSNMGMN